MLSDHSVREGIRLRVFSLFTIIRKAGTNCRASIWDLGFIVGGYRVSCSESEWPQSGKAVDPDERAMPRFAECQDSQRT